MNSIIASVNCWKLLEFSLKSGLISIYSKCDFYITFIDLVYDGCNLIKIHNFIMGLISRDLL